MAGSVLVARFRALGPLGRLELLARIVVEDEVQRLDRLVLLPEGSDEIGEGLRQLHGTAVALPGAEHLSAGHGLVERDLGRVLRVAE